ncbi:hypothetical protein ACGFYQ_32025 [Streptomyces sp. NPDC048258]|uniref:hypothetical protein n=1 Tax=Streptomyces sp. NPDC048258 TaxID=3365527 RepID=UPI0037236159
MYDERLHNAAPSMLATVLAERDRASAPWAWSATTQASTSWPPGCAGGPPDLLERVRAGFPTADVAVMDVPGGWERLFPGSGTVAAFVSPAE